MRIGELSQRTGVSVKNLRQYTDWGLIHTLGRNNADHRLFDSGALWCVQMITTLRDLGLTLTEIRTLTQARQVGPRLAELLCASRERLVAQITELQQTLRRIDEFEATYQDALVSDNAFWPGDPCGTPRECSSSSPTSTKALDPHPRGRP